MRRTRRRASRKPAFVPDWPLVRATGPRCAAHLTLDNQWSKTMNAHGPESMSSPGNDDQIPVDLRAFDDAYDAADDVRPSELPDGKYQTRVQDARLGQSQNGDPMLTYDLVVSSGPHTGRHIFKNSVINEATLRLIKADLKTCGVVLPRFSELPEYVKDLGGITLEISKRTRGEYTNVYFERRVSSTNA